MEGSRKLTLGNRRYLRKYTRYQPPRFDVVPVEVEPSQDDHADAPVPAQVVRGHVVGSGRDKDPVPARVVQEPVVGDVPDAEELQPDEVAVEQPADPEPTIRRSVRVTRVPSKYKDFVLGDEAQD